MSKYVMTDTYVAINGTALSDHANNCVLSDVADQIETTSFSPNSYKEYIPGMKAATITVTFFSDFQAASIHSILQPLYQTGGTFSVEIRPTSGAVSATNPKCTMISRLYEYAGINGKVGAAAEFDAVFHNAGTAGVVWGTS